MGDALETAAPEDSDVFVVLHGLGGEAGELGMGSFNLEEVLASGTELESKWIELRKDYDPDEGGAAEEGVQPSIGRVQVSTRVVRALTALKTELEGGGADGDGTAADAPSWRLPIDVGPVAFHRLPEPDRRGDRYLSLRVAAGGAAGGRAIPSKTLRWREKDVGSAAVPITMQRTFYISPAAGGFRAIRAAVDAKAAAADAAAADADGWLTIELLEMRNGEWQSLAHASLSARGVATAAGGTPFEVPIFDAFDADVGRVLVTLTSRPLIRALRSYSPPPAAVNPALRLRADAAKRAAAAADADDDADDDDGGGDGDASPPYRRVAAVAADEPKLELSVSRVHLAVPRAGARVLLEVQLGGETPLLRAALTSRLVPLDSRGVAEVDWSRSLRLPRGGALWRALGAAMGAKADADASAVRLSVVVVAAGGMRRALGTASHSLRAQLRSGDDAVGAPCTVHDARGQPVATLWLTVSGVNDVLVEAAKAAGVSVPPPPAAGARRRTAEEVRFAQAAMAVRLQAAARVMLAVRKLRLAKGQYHHTLGLTVHALWLPPALSHVGAASVSVDVAGLSHAPITSGYRPAAGPVVSFDTQATLPIERGGAHYDKLGDCLRTATGRIRLSVKAERAAKGVGATAAAVAAAGFGSPGGGGGGAGQWTIGDARVELLDLLRGGADLVEEPLPLYAGRRPIEGAKLLVSVAAVDALAAIARASRIPTYHMAAELADAAAVGERRTRSATVIQRAVRRAVVGLRWKRVRAQAADQAAATLVLSFPEVRAAASPAAAAAVAVHDDAIVAPDPSLLQTLVGAGERVCVQMTIELRGDAEETVESNWVRPPPPKPPKPPPAPPATAPPPAATGTEAVFEAARAEAAAAAAAAAAEAAAAAAAAAEAEPVASLRCDSISLSLQRCGKCRAAVSDAFRLDKPQLAQLRVRLYGGRAGSVGELGEGTISLTRLPLDEVSRDVTEYWLPLETPDGTPLLEVRVVVSSGAHLLHLIHTATRLRQADAFGAGGEWVASLAAENDDDDDTRRRAARDADAPRAAGGGGHGRRTP